MENRSHAVIALIFLLVMFLGSSAAAWWLQAGASQTKVYRMVSRYGVSGLKVQAPVKYKGLQVGTVKQVELDPDNPEQVLIRIGVKDETPVTGQTYAQLSSNGITGVSSIALHNKKTGAPALQTSADHPATIPFQRSLLQNLKNSGQQVLASAQAVADRAQQLLNAKNRKHFSQTLAQLDSATRKLNTLEQQLMPLLNRLPSLVDSANRTIAQGSRLMRKGSADADRLRDVLDASNDLVTGLAEQTVPKIDALTEQLQNTARQVDEMTETLKQNPDQVLFGGPKSRPGPGEPGYRPPR